MKILFLQSTSEIGGSDVALLGLIEGLDREHFEPCVLLPSDGPFVGRLEGLGCRVFIMPELLKLTTRGGFLHLTRYLLNYPRVVFAIARLIRREGVDIVHTNTIHNLYGFMAALLARRPHLWHAREIVAQSRALRALEVALARLFSARILVVSDAVGAMFAGAPAAQLRKLPDCVDTGRFHPGGDGRRVRGELGIPAEAPVAGLVARLDRAKGVDVFLRAAALCVRRVPRARFIVVGGPIAGQEAYEGELRGLADALGLRDVVHFALWRYGPGEMPSVYAALDLLAAPSRRPEGFGLAALEAMASGLPVVAARHGGALELCADGETGLLVAPGDAAELARAMIGLLGDLPRARVLGARGRLRAEALCGEQDSGRLGSIYREVVA